MSDVARRDDLIPPDPAADAGEGGWPQDPVPPTAAPTPTPVRTLAPTMVPPAHFVGGNAVQLLATGRQLFPAMLQAIRSARHQIWLATYIFHDDEASRTIAEALAAAARRGVWVGVVVDGFGSKATLSRLRDWMLEAGVKLTVFRPVDRWWRLLQPGQMRRLHQKLCVVDGEVGFVGGINIIDDCLDLNHGWFSEPRLDFAVELQGPLVHQVEQAIQAIWTRASLGADWRDELAHFARSAEPLARARRMLSRLRLPRLEAPEAAAGGLQRMRAMLLVRDNLRQRRIIEQAYIAAMQQSVDRIEIICPYFYPGRVFRRALKRAARRGVRVRLLLQGKPDYRIAALAARVLYDELLGAGVRIFEYTPTFLHAKVALVDGDWATVGSSNIDPLSLLLNLEANVVVRDAAFTADLAEAFESAITVSTEVLRPVGGPGWVGRLRRGFVAWAAYWFLRIAGMNGRY